MTWLHFSLANLTSVVTETAMKVFIHLFATLFVLLFCVGLSYGFYHLIAMITPSDMSVKTKMGTMEDIVLKTVAGGVLICAFMFVFIVSLAILILIGGVAYFVFKGFINFFSWPSALKNFTVDVELVDAPV